MPPAYDTFTPERSMNHSIVARQLATASASSTLRALKGERRLRTRLPLLAAPPPAASEPATSLQADDGRQGQV